MDRVSASSIELCQVIKDHEHTGLPLVIEGFHEHESWPTKMFTIEGFEECSESSGIRYGFIQFPANLILFHRYKRP